MAQLAEICEAKSEILWEDWQDANNSDGPVMDEDWLRGLTRQTQEIDFSELVQRSGNPSLHPAGKTVMMTPSLVK